MYVKAVTAPLSELEKQERRAYKKLNAYDVKVVNAEEHCECLSGFSAKDVAEEYAATFRGLSDADWTGATVIATSLDGSDSAEVEI